MLKFSNTHAHTRNHHYISMHLLRRQSTKRIMLK